MSNYKLNSKLLFKILNNLTTINNNYTRVCPKGQRIRKCYKCKQRGHEAMVCPKNLQKVYQDSSEGFRRTQTEKIVRILRAIIIRNMDKLQLTPEEMFLLTEPITYNESMHQGRIISVNGLYQDSFEQATDVKGQQKRIKEMVEQCDKINAYYIKKDEERKNWIEQERNKNQWIHHWDNFNRWEKEEKEIKKQQEVQKIWKDLDEISTESTKDTEETPVVSPQHKEGQKPAKADVIDSKIPKCCEPVNVEADAHSNPKQASRIDVVVSPPIAETDSAGKKEILWDPDLGYIEVNAEEQNQEDVAKQMEREFDEKVEKMREQEQKSKQANQRILEENKKFEQKSKEEEKEWKKLMKQAMKEEHIPSEIESESSTSTISGKGKNFKKNQKKRVKKQAQNVQNLLQCRMQALEKWSKGDNKVIPEILRTAEMLTKAEQDLRMRTTKPLIDEEDCR